MSAPNPWLSVPDTGPDTGSGLAAPPQPDQSPPWLPRLTGAAAPQPGGGVALTGQLPPLFTTTPDQPAGQVAGRLWVMGVHGGAGETTLAALLDGVATEHRWPQAPEPPPLLLVARTHAAGLGRLRHLATAWATGRLPGVDLLGAVLVADAPGRLPRPLGDLAALVTGGVPHTWRLGWAEELRLGTDLAQIESRRLRKTRREIQSLITTSATTSKEPHR